MIKKEKKTKSILSLLFPPAIRKMLEDSMYEGFQLCIFIYLSFSALKKGVMFLIKY
jgi:asparagine N-glycosylation enzyme membrane subunit Stt3